MTERLVLLPGWSYSAVLFDPLIEALQAQRPGIEIRTLPLPELTQADPRVWLDMLDSLVPAGSWLAGWSLGGMLALALAARRGDGCPGVITLGSNLRFVASAEWPEAMAAEVFTAFRDGAAAQMATTRKRFAMLCAQGGPEPRSLSRQLQQGALEATDEVLLAGLDVLAALDNRALVDELAVPQLHLFAAGDALVPVAAADAIERAQGRVQVLRIPNAGHAFVIEQAESVAEAMAAFVEAHRRG